MDRSTLTWRDYVRRTIGLVEFYLPFDGPYRMGASAAVEELQSIAVTYWHERKHGAVQIYAFADLVAGTLLESELDPLHGDVSQAFEDLDDGPQADLVASLRSQENWPSHFDVARNALDAFEQVDDYFGGGGGSQERNRHICARLEAEGMARHAESIEGASFLYGFGRLFAHLQDWQHRVHGEMMRRQQEERQREPH